MITYYTKEGKSTCTYTGDIPFNKLHKLDGPAIELENYSKEWWINGKRHRLDGPAIEWSNGSKKWWINGVQHRLDGPAVEYKNGSKHWYINGKKLNKNKVEKWIRGNNIDLKNKAHQVLFVLRFG